MPTHEPHVDYEDLAEYEGTPYLTVLVNFCSAVGVMVTVYCLLFLPGALKKGSEMTIYVLLGIVVSLNVALRLIRAWRRRTLGLSTAERRYRLGISPREFKRRN